MTHTFFKIHLVSKTYYSTTMDSITAALQDLSLQTKPNISATARQYNIDRTTLSKRYNGVASTKQEQYENSRLLAPEQEQELLNYINTMSERYLPPTPAMLRAFASKIAGREVGKDWFYRFCKRNSAVLDKRYLTAMDAARQKADSIQSYKVYFTFLKEKIAQYEIQSDNMYNMDKKGFLIGFLGKTKRIFTKETFNRGKLKGHKQDGNRDWATILATICADGTWLPPAIIYSAVTGNIQDSWVQDFDSHNHQAYFASSPTGWTNEALGYAWLTQIFERHTQAKARRQWRLLFVDGHGSHINMRFLDWCIAYKILVAVYPPHSTHRLQPLDVSLFSPLAIAYSKQLDQEIHESQGLSSVTKRDFFRLFWPAFINSFTSKNILSGWAKTGINPLDPEVVLGTLESREEAIIKRPTSATSSSSSALSASDWRKVRALLKDVVSEVLDEQQAKKVKRLNTTITSMTTENTILRAEVSGYRRALINEKKRRKRGKQLFEQFRAEEGTGATFFSLTKIETAKQLLLSKEQAKQAQKAQKEAQTKQKKEQQALNKLALKQRKVNRLQKQRDRAAAIAYKAAQKEYQEDAKKATKQLNDALQASAKKQTRRKPVDIHLQLPFPQFNSSASLESSKLAPAASGRTRRLPKHLANYELDI